MEKSIIIGDKIGAFTPPEGFGFASYIYLHGEAETINGYDCCYGNMKTFQRLLTCHLFACEIQLQDGSIHDGIAIPCFVENKVKALVCLCTDTESIKHALTEYFSPKSISTTMESSEQDIMYEKYPEIFNIIRNYNLSR